MLMLKRSLRLVLVSVLLTSSSLVLLDYLFFFLTEHRWRGRDA
jgi:preprotein translocase subunit SecE